MSASKLVVRQSCFLIISFGTVLSVVDLKRNCTSVSCEATHCLFLADLSEALQLLLPHSLGLLALLYLQFHFNLDLKHIG